MILADNQLLILLKYYLIVDSETHKAGTTNIHSVGSMLQRGPGLAVQNWCKYHTECSQNLLKMYIYFTLHPLSFIMGSTKIQPVTVAVLQISGRVQFCIFAIYLT